MSCCLPAREGGPTPADSEPHVAARPAPREQVRVPGGAFVMGDAFGEGYPGDGESALHTVVLDEFHMDATAVTNAQFAAFVADTGYRTDAERHGTSAVFHLQLAAGSGDVLGRSPAAPWWLEVAGADWAHPAGRLSDLDGSGDHPVVHVSHRDTLAYCAWAGRRLPTEAQFEYAARGGQHGRRYPWGDELTPSGLHHANIWQGSFPSHDTGDDGYTGTCPVRSFPPNDFGLYEVSGNVWEWCADWFSASYYRQSPRDNPQGPTQGTARVTRGGSYLCHDSYCNRYRVAARSANTPESSSANCGFRTVSNDD